ncbi:MAG TPA: NADH-ubiquinone oxidoreductase-F iron-sulfur binding region domain-containing protein [Vicinamibacteria bacterium]
MSYDLIGRVAASGLRGRGGGWFPVARKWHAVRVEGGFPVVIANGGEGEPGSIKDRIVMTRRAADVVAGLAVAAEAVGAREAFVYVKGSHVAAAEALERAAPAAGEGLTVKVVRGEDSYIGGEETALLEYMEGRRAWPRPKPPLPAAVGLHGRPTLVQNVDTLARVPAAVADPDGYRGRETALVSLWGHVRWPGAYEVPLGTPLRRLVEDWGGGAPDGIGLIFPAGPSASPLTAAEADAPLDPNGLRALGSALGTAAVLVVGRSTCPLAVGASLARFFAREACGQCPPCVMGTASLARIVSAIEAGAARPRELADLAESAGFMSSHGYCAHARTGAAAVTGLLSRVRASVEEHLAAGRCPRPNGDCGPFDPGSPELRAIEALA